MAIYNEILVGRYNRMMQKLFGMKGPASVRQLAGEIVPTFPLFGGVENRYLEQWDRFVFRYSVAGVAAQQASARIRNPAGSNVIAVFEKINAFGTVADSPGLEFGAQAADYGTLGVGNRVDPRGRAQTGLICSSSGTGVAMTSFTASAYPANGGIDFILFEEQEITLLPGDAVQVRSGVVNQALNGGFLWRERFLEESERQ